MRTNGGQNTSVTRVAIAAFVAVVAVAIAVAAAVVVAATDLSASILLPGLVNLFAAFWYANHIRAPVKNTPMSATKAMARMNMRTSDVSRPLEENSATHCGSSQLCASQPQTQLWYAVSGG